MKIRFANQIGKIKQRTFFVYCPLCGQEFLFRRLLSHKNKSHPNEPIQKFKSHVIELINSDPKKWVVPSAKEKFILKLDQEKLHTQPYLHAVNEKYNKFVVQATLDEISKFPPAKTKHLSDYDQKALSKDKVPLHDKSIKRSTMRATKYAK